MKWISSENNVVYKTEYDGNPGWNASSNSSEVIIQPIL